MLFHSSGGRSRSQHFFSVMAELTLSGEARSMVLILDRQDCEVRRTPLFLEREGSLSISSALLQST